MKTEDLWGLNDTPRIPITASGWAQLTVPVKIAPPRWRVENDLRSFIAAAFPDRDDRLLKLVSQLLVSRADDFAIAAQSIKSEAWRLLYYRGAFVPEALGEFRFHPEQALRAFCFGENNFDDPPSAWLGTQRDTHSIASELETTIREMGRTPSAAAWLILGLAQRAPLSKAEVLFCEWWDPAWLKAFAEHVQFIR